MCNVFEDVVIAHYPVVGTIRDQMMSHQPLGVSLSGTGPALFAMVAKEAAAREVADAVGRMAGVEVFLTRTFAEER